MCARVEAVLLALCCALLMPAAAHGQSERGPFPKEESSRLIAEIRKDPENDGLRRQLIDLLRPFGRSMRPPAEGFYRLMQDGAALVDTGKPEEIAKGIAIYKRAANAAPWYAGVYMSLGMSYDEAKDWAQAKRYYDLFLYAGKDYSSVPAEIGIIEQAKARVERELARRPGAKKP